MFKREERGPRFRGSYALFAAAERLARESAIAEGCEFFVFSFKEYRELASFFPDGSSRFSPPEPLTFRGVSVSQILPVNSDSSSPRRPD